MDNQNPQQLLDDRKELIAPEIWSILTSGVLELFVAEEVETHGLTEAQGVALENELVLILMSFESILEIDSILAERTDISSAVIHAIVKRLKTEVLGESMEFLLVLEEWKSRAELLEREEEKKAAQESRAIEKELSAVGAPNLAHDLGGLEELGGGVSALADATPAPAVVEQVGIGVSTYESDTAPAAPSEPVPGTLAAVPAFGAGVVGADITPDTAASTSSQTSPVGNSPFTKPSFTPAEQSIQNGAQSTLESSLNTPALTPSVPPAPTPVVPPAPPIPQTPAPVAVPIPIPTPANPTPATNSAPAFNLQATASQNPRPAQQVQTPDTIAANLQNEPAIVIPSAPRDVPAVGSTAIPATPPPVPNPAFPSQ